MKRSNHSAISPLLILSSLVQFSLAAPTTGTRLPGGGTKWEPNWSEKFDRPEAQLEDRWKSHNTCSTHILSSWRENAVVSNGTLKLLKKKEKRGCNDWSSGKVLPKEEFQYGDFTSSLRPARHRKHHFHHRIQINP